VAVATLKEAETNVEVVRLLAFDAATLDLYLDRLD
jgi:hypothetical protein